MSVSTKDTHCGAPIKDYDMGDNNNFRKLDNSSLRDGVSTMGSSKDVLNNETFAVAHVVILWTCATGR